MPTYEFGNIWDIYEETDLLCITTNSMINKNNELVMGGGIALEAKNRFPGLAKELGRIVIQWHEHMFKSFNKFKDWYGILYSPLFPKLLCFQTKTSPFLKSDIGLIRYSCSKLTELIGKAEYDQKSYNRIDLAFPGIGLGGLTPQEVEPALRILPDIVHVWRYK